jgi:hypothetical protein
MPYADIIRPFGAKRAKYIGVFFVGNHLRKVKDKKTIENVIEAVKGDGG